MTWGIREEIIVPSYEGRSIHLKAGEELMIIDLEGKQVGDFICFNRNDLTEHVSPVHMRASLRSIRLKVGDYLYSNRRRPLMQLVDDTVCQHDFFFPACDFYRYKMDFDDDNHPNCHDSLMKALKKYQFQPEHLPDPINWFMYNKLDSFGDYEINEPLSKPGNYVKLKALEDCLVALSSCSQDMAPVNGWKVTPLKMQVIGEIYE